MQHDVGRATPGLGFDVHVWQISLDNPISQADLATLSSAELTRGSRFVFVRDQRRHLAAYAALRRVLSFYTGRAPEELDIRETPEGKPLLADGRLAFNLSHSGALALVAIAAAGQVGVDIELVASLSNEMSIARALFAPREIEHLASLTGDARRVMFYRLWTCREALLKAAGVGLSGVGLEIGVDASDKIYIRTPPAELNEPMRIGEFRLGSDYLGAVAWGLRGTQGIVCLFDIDVMDAS